MMHAIILAAGYATRLYPLTKDTPKPLLKVADRAIIEHIIRKVEEINGIDGIYIVTNGKFAAHFSEWLENFDAKIPVGIINDGTGSNDDRLGALGDVHFAITNKNIDDDVIVIAGDNLFELSLIDVSNFFRKRKSNVIVLHDVKDIELAKHYGIVEINHNNLFVNFFDKTT